MRITQDRLFGTLAIGVVLTALSLAGIVPRPIGWVLLLGWATVSTVALIVTIRVRDRLRGFVGALAAAQVRVVDPAFALMPPHVSTLTDELTSLGFRVVGVTDTVVAGRPDFRSWVLVEPSGETWIEAGDAGRAIAVVLSGTPSGRQVEAAWPHGMRIDEPALLAAPASATLELTLADHRARLAAARRAEAATGEPLLDPARPDGWRIRTFDEYLTWEPLQRARTGGLRLRTELHRRIEPAVRFWAVSTVASVACGLLLAASA